MTCLTNAVFLLKLLSSTFARFAILTFEIDFTKRRFLESFFIHNSENAINDKENCFYSEIYDNLT